MSVGTSGGRSTGKLGGGVGSGRESTRLRGNNGLSSAGILSVNGAEDTSGPLSRSSIYDRGVSLRCRPDLEGLRRNRKD